MKIAVLVKQVPSAESQLSLNSDSNLLERSLTDPVLNPADLVAVEAAIRFCEGNEAQNLCISMGPVGLEQSTKRALAMGLDESVHITDPKLHGADIWVTATTLAKAILKTGANFVFAGTNTSDGLSGAVPAYIAGLLGWNYVFAKSDLDIDSVLNRKEPTVLVIDSAVNTPRLPNFKGIAAAKTKPITNWALADLEISDLKPKVKIVEQQSIVRQKNPEKLLGDANSIAKQILSKIEEWKDSENSEYIEAKFDHSEFAVYEANDLESAAKFAAENEFALVVNATNAFDGKITKRIFDNKLEVTLEAEDKCVVTKATKLANSGLAIGFGGGVRADENLAKIPTLLSANIVGTAAALEKGIISAEQLVGESGSSIQPNIYLSFGVSGAHHHMVGIKGAKRLISVNLDPEAEIFKESDLAVVADANEILAALVQELGK